MKERIQDNRLETIVAQLAADGFPSDLETAHKVQRASMRGALSWTQRRLTTADESRLDLRAHGQSRKRSPDNAAAAERDAVVCTQSWAGRLETRVKVLAENSTAARYRVRYVEPSVGRAAGEAVLVPKHAVRFIDGPAPETATRHGMKGAAADGGRKVQRRQPARTRARPTACPVCQCAYFLGRCANPACWVDANPKESVPGREEREP